MQVPSGRVISIRAVSVGTAAATGTIGNGSAVICTGRNVGSGSGTSSPRRVDGLRRADTNQRTASNYIFGAICSQEGEAAGLILPWCNTTAMTLHLVEIAIAVAPGAHAVLLVDQAEWDLSPKLVIPLVPPPPKCPELNPTEISWQFMRDNCALRQQAHQVCLLHHGEFFQNQKVELEKLRHHELQIMVMDGINVMVRRPDQPPIR